jgi:hypothetical membrane protein
VTVAPIGAAKRAARHFLFWGVVGLIAQVAFMAGWLIAETWQGPRYNPIRYTISDLQAATAPHVWFPITCFAIGGVGTFAFAVFGLRPALARAGKVAACAPWMLAFSALALGNSFPLIPFRLIDPGATAARQLHSAGGLTDAIASSLAFVVLVLTPFPLWRRLASLAEWRRLRPVMMAARILGPLCFVAMAISSSVVSVQGLAERILVTVCVAWVVALALTLIANTRHARLLTTRGEP